jgi:hypothetical protein
MHNREVPVPVNIRCLGKCTNSSCDDSINDSGVCVDQLEVEEMSDIDSGQSENHVDATHDIIKDQARGIVNKLRSLVEEALSHSQVGSKAVALDMLENLVDQGSRQMSQYIAGTTTVLIDNVPVYNEPRRRTRDARRQGFGES